MVRKTIQESLESYMQHTAPLEYHDILIPEFDFGAKRPVLDHRYLTALHDPRVRLLRSSSITVTGPHEIQVHGAESFRADAIILANGFRTQDLLTPMILTGRNGEELPGIWHREGSFASAYMG